MKKNKGFTLIELLVVIAIIGLLSTLAVVSLNSARAKARDARRVSDVKQLSTLLEMEAASLGSQALTGDRCITSPYNSKNCTGPGQVNQFFNFTDPSGNSVCNAVANPAAPCQYGITSNANGAASTGDYKICFYLESGAGSLTNGPAKIKTGGQMSSGNCNQ